MNALILFWLMQTCKHFFFYKTINSKFSKNISEIHENVKFCLQFFICFCACQPMILPLKFASRVFSILTNFRDFLKPETVKKNMIYIIFDINGKLMFECCFDLEPCNFPILLLETL